MQRWKKLLPHMTIILGLYIGTMWVLDQFNPLMDFLDNSSTMAILFLFCILAVVNGFVELSWLYAEEEKKFQDGQQGIFGEPRKDSRQNPDRDKSLPDKG
jgi:hypothetical protein